MVYLEKYANSRVVEETEDEERWRGAKGIVWEEAVVWELRRESLCFGRVSCAERVCEDVVFLRFPAASGWAKFKWGSGIRQSLE